MQSLKIDGGRFQRKGGSLGNGYMPISGSSAAQGENDDDGICSRLPPPDETGTARAPLH